MKIKQPKTYKIKIPVYASDPLEKPTDIFTPVSYKDMINLVKRRIDDYNSVGREIRTSRRNKTFEKHIKGISYYEVILGKVTGLLLQVTAFTTNYLEGFVEESQKVQMTQKTKIGSENNFILVYPLIYGNDPNNYKIQWLFLLYEDPNKDNADLVQTAKLVFNKVLDISVKNIKLDSVIESIKSNQITPLVSVKLISIDFDTDDTPNYKAFLVEHKTKTISEYSYKDLPSEEAIALLSKKSQKQFSYQSIKSFLFGKKELRVTHTKDDDTNRIIELVEEIYNSEVLITEDELQNELYNQEFILSKLKPVLSEYLSKNISDEN